MKPHGALVFVLHSHIPYVINHGRWPHGMDWLNEAAAESYLPILNVLNRLASLGQLPKLTIGIVPVLAEQLSNSVFKEEFLGYLRMKIEAAGKDVDEFTKNEDLHLAGLGKFWRDFYLDRLHDFQEKYQGDIVGAFRSLQDQGAVELLTSAATHAYLPLLAEDICIRAQFEIGIASYVRSFGRKPRGVWLPECAYRPGGEWTSPSTARTVERSGLEEFVRESGIQYFIAESHLREKESPPEAYYPHGLQGEIAIDLQNRKRPEPIIEDAYRAYYVADSAFDPAATALVRDPLSGLQVWSRDEGYPGDANYLEFHKKKHPGGLRYWRVTSTQVDLGQKEEYHPDATRDRIRDHASHFVQSIREKLAEHFDQTGKPGILCAPFDAELFGHWWFEGPQWLAEVLVRCREEESFELMTASEAIEKMPPEQLVQLPAGSWGWGGRDDVWDNVDTRWTWRAVHYAERRMVETAGQALESEDPLFRRVAKQMARELLLLESSDWQFLITTRHAQDYAEARFHEHKEDFDWLDGLATKLAEGGEASDEEISKLAGIESKDRLFDNIDLSLWREPAPVQP